MVVAKVLKARYNVGKRTARYPLAFFIRPLPSIMPPLTVLPEITVKALSMRKERREAGNPIGVVEGLRLGVTEATDTFVNQFKVAGEELLSEGTGPIRKEITNMIKNPRTGKEFVAQESKKLDQFKFRDLLTPQK